MSRVKFVKSSVVPGVTGRLPVLSPSGSRPLIAGWDESADRVMFPVLMEPSGCWAPLWSAFSLASLFGFAS